VNALALTPIIAQLDMISHSMSYCDASSIGSGFVLMQEGAQLDMISHSMSYCDASSIGSGFVLMQEG